jgi:hypothetical protein
VPDQASVVGDPVLIAAWIGMKQQPRCFYGAAGEHNCMAVDAL